MKTLKENLKSKKHLLRVIVILFIGMAIGYWFRGNEPGAIPAATLHASANVQEKSSESGQNTLYACPMMCVPPMKAPGDCPVCGMELLPVEAGEKSGALVTAEFALNQNREVFAVPGQVTSMRSRGTNRLIKEGAKLVMSVGDVLEELAPSLDPLLRTGSPLMPEIRFSEDERKIYETLSHTPLSIDDIAKRTRLSTSKALTVLLSMELNGAVKQLSGKMFVRT